MEDAARALLGGRVVGAASPPPILPPSVALSLQRAAGNRAVVELLERRRGVAPRPAAPALQRQPRGGKKAESPADRATRLSKALGAASTRVAALAELRGLSATELDGLETAALSLARAKGETVLRGISFVRYWSTHALADKPGAALTDAGKPAKLTKASVVGGTVTMDLGVKMGTRVGYALTFAADAPPKAPAGSKAVSPAPVATDAQWLQFIWRRVTVESAASGGRTPPPTAIERRLGRASGGDPSLFTYPLTTEPSAPSWNTDTSTKDSPFFEESTNTVERSPTTLRMVDTPSADPVDIDNAFKGTPGAVRVISHFHATTYLVKGMDPVYQAQVDLKFVFDDPKKMGSATPKLDPSGSGKPVTQIEPEHRARLLVQFPELDWLRGGTLKAPTMRPRPGDITGALAGWTTSDLDQRFADAATAAGADGIDSVWSLSAAAIQQVPTDAEGTAAAPGLARVPKLQKGGLATVRFIDGKGTIRAQIPAERTGRVPRLLLLMTPAALQRDRPSAIATIRHEMEHARHFQLAIDWLVKWRTEAPQRTFANWMADQKLAKDTKAIVAVATGDRVGSEIMAHVEGAIAALDSLPATPDASQLTKGEYPAAINELKELGGQGFLRLTSDVRDMTLERLRRACVANPARTAAMTAWIEVLLDPSRFSPKASDVVTSMVRNDFGAGTTSSISQKNLRTFVEDLKAGLAKPAPRK